MVLELCLQAFGGFAAVRRGVREEVQDDFTCRVGTVGIVDGLEAEHRLQVHLRCDVQRRAILEDLGRDDVDVSPGFHGSNLPHRMGKVHSSVVFPTMLLIDLQCLPVRAATTIAVLVTGRPLVATCGLALDEPTALSARHVGVPIVVETASIAGPMPVGSFRGSEHRDLFHDPIIPPSR